MRFESVFLIIARHFLGDYLLFCFVQVKYTFKHCVVVFVVVVVDDDVVYHLSNLLLSVRSKSWFPWEP